VVLLDIYNVNPQFTSLWTYSRVVFTDADGLFILKRKKPGDYEVKVDFSAILLPQRFEAVYIPSRIHTMTAGTLGGQGSPELVIALKRVAVLAASQTP
jgi:hypothetical protein